MKITTKINLITTAWLILVLLIINTVVYFSFIKITVGLEEEELSRKGNTILKEVQLNNPSVRNDQLKSYLIAGSYIRVILPNGQVAEEVTNEPYLLKKIKPALPNTKEVKRDMIRTSSGEEQVLYIRLPITDRQSLTGGTLEIGQTLHGLEIRKDILLSILAASMLLAVILSLLGGKMLSNMIMRPISSMIKTMEDIEQSGIPQKINIQNKSRDELEQMASTFNSMIDRLQANINKQEQFISDASHELKTPLTVIKSYANLLRRRGTDDRELSEEAIQVINSEAARMQKMTDTFLELAKTQNNSNLDFSTIDLVQFCKSIQQQLKKVYKRDIALHSNHAEINILGDELKLKQVIIIVLDNAIKYSNDKIDLYIEKNRNHAIIKVKDYGIGIPEHEVKNIFERFYRIDKARSRETGGTGLGLSIAKNIMKQQNGEINITSVENEGTEVELFLPLQVLEK
ncbi:sensor histidine kinase [Pseudalkalibacillus caeni]|uniref:histidine kinase n=1 Tax=Exobacillus caeni TaxID=2574798 RepID=A0A5R9F9R4_9BACL|nr:ATP-binding protein [Pseudalkalibacillus caeni]TLS36445.1 HAMP domain-containing histidine kinase [Pseudalkalibacillus caeni]